MPSNRLYHGNPDVRDTYPDTPVSLPTPPNLARIGARQYFADPGLREAVNVALQLRQPLLLTGKPGTGKTLLAYSLALELGLEDPIKFETKSTSEARDLFYHFDSLSRFHAPSSEKANDGLSFLQLRALGEAIVRSMDVAQIKNAFGVEEVTHVHPELADSHQPHRSIVLIDEVDKAPRDFPNDILNEIENLYFRIPELQIDSVSANLKMGESADLSPVIILTSNSEKALPDAFLRRCVFYHIPFPERDRLEKIVRSQLASLGGAG